MKGFLNCYYCFFRYSPGGGEQWYVNNWDLTVRKRRRREKKERNLGRKEEKRKRNNSD